MKAKDWKFDRYLPDIEDIEAFLKAMEGYFSLPEIPCRNAAVREHDAFHSGFNRGIAWMIAKMDVRELENLLEKLKRYGEEGLCIDEQVDREIDGYLIKFGKVE